MRKRILMIIPTLSGGGAERVVSNLSMELREKYEIDILLDYADVEYPYFGNMIAINSSDTKYSHIGAELLTYIKKLFLLRKMKKKRLYDCYISHSDISHILNLITGNTDCRIILTLHNSIANMRKSRIKNIIEWFAGKYYKNADRIVAVSGGVASEFIEKYSVSPEKMTVIWNGSNIEKIKREARMPLEKEQEEWFAAGRTVTTMGRLSQQKGQVHLIRAFAKVAEKYKDARLLLLGTGELHQSFCELIKALKLEKNVILCGFQKNPFSTIARSDLFVFSSLWEGFGYALEEAICCDVPCISTDFKYGAREILKYYDGDPLKDAVYTDYGVLLPVCEKEPETDAVWSKEEAVMADAIIGMLEDAEYRKKVIGNNRLRLEEFSLERMADKWISVIEGK